MPPQQLLDYIQQELARGVPPEEIKRALLESGWQQQMVDEAFVHLARASFAQAGGGAQPFATVGQVAATGGSLPRAGDLLREAFANFKERWKTLLGVMVLVALLQAGVMALVGGMAYRVSVLGEQGAPLTAADVWVTLAGFIVGFLVAVFLSALGIAALFHAANEPVSVWEALRRGARHSLSFLWIGFLISAVAYSAFFIVAFLLMVVAFILQVVTSVSADLRFLGGTGALESGLSLFLVVVLGIASAVTVWVWFLFAPFILVAENERGTRALLKSREYVRGFWWGVFGRLLVFVGLNVAIGIAVAVINIILTAVLGKAGALVAFATTFAVQAFFVVPYGTLYLFALYRALRQLKGEIAFAPSRLQRAVVLVLAFAPAIVIVGLAAATTFASLKGAVERVEDAKKVRELREALATPEAIDAKQKHDITFLRKFIEVYFDTYGKYPDRLEAVGSLGRTLKDPVTGEPYRYQALNNGQDYELCALDQTSREWKCVTSQN